MKKTYRAFMNESKFGDFDLAARLEKVKIELKGNKYLKSILKALALDSPLEDDMSEGIVKTMLGDKVIDFVLARIHKFIQGVKDDFQSLMASDNWKDRGAVIYKLATKAYICAVILNVVIDELGDIAKGDKEPELIDMKKAESEMGKILSITSK